MHVRTTARRAAIAFAGAVALSLVPASLSSAAPTSFLGSLGAPAEVASTVPPSGPAAGDQNPYGVAVVQHSVGALVKGDVLVSNFNAASNLQGTGTTIMQVDPVADSASVFARIDPGSLPGPCPGGVGLTTALAVFDQGWVVVGSLPVTNAGTGSPEAGCLIVLDSHGTPRETISGRPINGPWDLTAAQKGDDGTIFVTNVLNGTLAKSPATVDRGTVVRLELDLGGGVPPRVRDEEVVADHLAERTDTAALVVGPTGVALSGDTLYISDSVNNRILAVPDAFERDDPSRGRVVSTGNHLVDPLGMTVSRNGDIITVNGGDGNAVETTPGGAQIATATLDTNNGGGGNLFGVALTPDGRGIYFVDDAPNVNALFVAHQP